MPRRTSREVSALGDRPRHRRRRARLQRPKLIDPYLVALAAFGLAKLAMVRWVVFSSGRAGVLGIWLEVSAVVALLGVSSLLGKKGRLPALLVYGVFSVVCWANAVYAAYFRQAFDYSMIGLAGQTTALGGVIVELLKPWHVLFVLDLPILLWLAIAGRRGPARARGPVIAATVVAALLFALQLGLAVRAYDGVEVTTVAGPFGLVPAQAASLVKGMTGAQSASASTRAPSAVVRRYRTDLGIYGGKAGVQRLTPEKWGVASGKNVVIIQWESLQGFVLNGRVNGREVTPRLNELAAESWAFPNSYSQTGAGNTSDAEFILNTGLLGPLTQPASVAYSPYELPSLPRLLEQQAGYTSYTMHANTDRFWNRRELYPALGFTAYYTRKEIGMRDKMWVGPSDEVVLEKAADVLAEKRAKTGRPVLLEVVTMTSHGPFEQPPDDRRPLKVTAKQRKTIAGAYVGSLSFTDQALGRFIDKLKRTGLYDDTLIVVVGDHTGYQTDFPEKADDAILSQMLGGRSYGQVDRQNVPIVLHIPGQKKGRLVESLRAQVDVMPTIAELVGLDLSRVPHIGRVLFDDGKRVVATRYYYPAGTYVTENAVVVPGLGGAPTRAYSLSTGQEVEPSGTDLAARAYVKTMNRLSDEWVRSRDKRADAKAVGDAIIPGQKK